MIVKYLNKREWMIKNILGSLLKDSIDEDIGKVTEVKKNLILLADICSEVKEESKLAGDIKFITTRVKTKYDNFIKNSLLCTNDYKRIRERQIKYNKKYTKSILLRAHEEIEK